MANLMPGDVFPFGAHNYIAVMVNDSRCRALPLDSSVRIVKFGNGKEVALRDYGRKIDISANSEVPVLERRGWQGANEFLRSRKASAPESKPDAQQNNETKTMKTKTKTNLRPLNGDKKITKPRGGLAADLAAAKSKLPGLAGDQPEPTPKPAKVPKVKTAKPESTEPKPPSKTKERYEFLKAQFDGSRPKSEIALNLVKFNGLEATEANLRKAKANVNNFPSNPHPDGFKASWSPEPSKTNEVKA
jgi:hypothetical protein